MQPLNVGQCFSDGWAAMKKNLVPAIVGHLLLVVIFLVIGIIPVVGWLAMPILAGPLIGGLIWLFLNIVMDRQPAIGDIFKGFSRFVDFLATFWLFVALSLVFLIPAVLLSLIGLIFGTKGFIALMVVFGLAAYVAFVIVALRYCLAYFILADNLPVEGAIAAFKRSEVMTRGQRMSIFVVFLLAWLLGMAGVLALGIGVLFTAPLAGCVVAAMYKQLRAAAEGQVPMAGAASLPPSQF